MRGLNQQATGPALPGRLLIREGDKEANPAKFLLNSMQSVCQFFLMHFLPVYNMISKIRIIVLRALFIFSKLSIFFEVRL